MLEVLSERRALFKGDQGQECIAGQGEIESGVGPAVTVIVFTPSAGVTFPVIAIFHTPVSADSLDAALALDRGQARYEPPGVDLFVAVLACLFAPATLY